LFLPCTPRRADRPPGGTPRRIAPSARAHAKTPRLGANVTEPQEGRTLEKRQLGNSDLRITPIGFGAWAIGGGDWAFAWGNQDDADSVAAIRRAIACGVNWIDTAAVYGLGHSEEVVARALSDVPGSERPYVFTKCSRVWDDKKNISHSLKAASVRRELENSLRRLRLETIDLYQIHWPDLPSGGPANDIEEGWGAMAAAQKAGKVRCIGVSNFDVGQLERIAKLAPPTSVQPPYSMIRRGIEHELLPWCRSHGVGTLIYSPMQSGLLSGTMTRERVAAFPDNDWRKRGPEFQEPKLSKNLALAERLGAIGARHGKNAGEVAIAWTLRHPAVTAAIVGARKADQVDGFVGAANLRLSEADLQEIDAGIAA
jgi:aryl-alcohol dehydrogenase-like predicted oxidoreductase